MADHRFTDNNIVEHVVTLVEERAAMIKQQELEKPAHS
jgi:hypothetical protein